jgi:hypothetical protein
MLPRPARCASPDLACSGARGSGGAGASGGRAATAGCSSGGGGGGGGGRRVDAAADAEADSDGGGGEGREGSPRGGARQAGWLWKRFGHGHASTWRRLWVSGGTLWARGQAPGGADCLGSRPRRRAPAHTPPPLLPRRSPAPRQFQLCEDRLCYQDDGGAGATSGSGALDEFSSGAATLGAATAGARGGGGGRLRYLPLDRIPVRPLPHRQHAPDPVVASSRPDIGVAIIDNRWGPRRHAGPGLGGLSCGCGVCPRWVLCTPSRCMHTILPRVLTGQPAEGPPRTVFSVVVGSHTHYLAAETPGEAAEWVAALRAAWLHCFKHVARRGGCSGGSGDDAGAAQRLAAENARLRESLRAEAERRSAEVGECWRCAAAAEAGEAAREKGERPRVDPCSAAAPGACACIASNNCRARAPALGACCRRIVVEERARAELLASQLESRAVYEVDVATGDAKGGATSARVYLEAWGRDGRAGASSGEVRLDLDAPEAPFQRGATDRFEVALHDVGAPCLVRVWHDNSGRHPDWRLERVSMRKKGAPDWVHFPCGRWAARFGVPGGGGAAACISRLPGPSCHNKKAMRTAPAAPEICMPLRVHRIPRARWLSTEQDDGRICRELPAAGGGAPAAAAAAAYRVTIVTGDVRGAGTDANVAIMLHGARGDGARHRLGGRPQDFER